MTFLPRLIAVAALAATLPASQILAQGRTGWAGEIAGLAVYQGSADLDDGGDFSADRAFVRAAAIYRFQNGGSAGLQLSYGQFSYDFSFDGNQPWDDITDIRLSLPMRFRIGETGDLFVSPQIRWDYQDGASASDGETYGVFAGFAWQVSDRLRIGPAFGAFSTLDDGGTDFFPALLVDWDISSRWNFSTGAGLGATQGPGLSLSYAYSDAVSLSLGLRSEDVEFRLDDDGPAPGGVGQDSSFPVVVALDYSPSPRVLMNAFVGAEFNGELSLKDAAGVEISRQDYDTAPIAGFAVRVRF